MNITIFTANKLRHNYLVNKLSYSAEKLFVFRESKRKKKVNGNFIKKYFNKVSIAERKIFKSSRLKKNVSVKNIKYGEINSINLKSNEDFLKSNIFIVFGTSIIKNKLLKFLIKKKAINIHMGVSPYYNGTDCNFWALFDNKPNFVGGTIQNLSAKVDQGKIIMVVKSKFQKNIFDYAMLSVKLTIDKLATLINNKSILKKKRINQNLKKNIRNTKSKEFTNEIVKKFFERKRIKKN